ncbi:MAG TPA: TPM domain-containing protein, partial [Terriglobales bacterium]|nr:TPM domain-containing protein [Terriglobales bacterium]
MLARYHLPSLFIIAALCCTVALADDISKIRPTSYVTDLAGVIDASTRQRVEALGTEVERKTGAQIAVVTVRSLDGRPIEEYAVDLFKHLGVGKQDDRGVLLLLAPNDRRYRFEIGYGVEPVITDARAGDIGREMVPLLRQNRYSTAVELGTSRVASLIAADKKVKLSGTPIPASEQPEERPRFPLWVVPLGLF